MPRIPEEIIEQINAANDIVEVVGSYFPLKRMGAMFKALCPFHTERTPSFTVNPQRQIFKCFGCGAGGSAIRFVMDYEKTDFLSAARKLAERVNIRIPEAEMTSEDFARADLRRRLLALHAEAADFFHHQLMRGRAADIAREYMKKRGLSADVAKSWKIGYAPDAFDALLNHARSQRFEGEALAESGLFSAKEDGGRLYDRFRGRLMFPICNDMGEVIAFSGRILDAEKSPAKYVNSPETMLFTKGAVLFGLHKSKRALVDKKQAVVCEGQIDLITAYEHGVQNVIAPQGTAFTERQARILKRYVDEVVLCFDSDAAGEKAAERSLPSLLAQSLLVRIAEMPPGEDPDSLIRKHGGEAFAVQIGKSRDFFEFQIERQAQKPDFVTPRGKVAAAKKLAEFIQLIPDAVTREAVLNNAATRLEFGAAELRRMLKEKPAQAQGGADDLEPSKPAARIELPPTHQWLLLLSLRHAVSRAWLQSRGVDRVLEDGTPASALLAKVLAAEFRPDDNASVNTFLGSLGPGEENTLATILERPVPPDAKVLAEDCWHELERRDITRKRQGVEARLRTPGLSPEEQARLHQRVIDLHREMSALPPPRPPRLAS